MRVLSVIPVMGIGGAEAVAATLTAGQVARGHTAVLASAGGSRVDDVTRCGVEHVPVPLGSRRPQALLRTAGLLRRHARGARPDVVHAHNVKAAVAARAAVGRSTPVVATLHGAPAASMRTATRLLRLTADRVVAVSPYVAQQLLDHGFPADRLDIIANGVERPAPVPRGAARDALGLPHDAVVAVCLARLVEQKRHDLLLDAWRGLPDHAVLLLAGDGPTRPALERRAERHRLDGRVRFLGARRDVDTLLAAADLAVLATDWEGLPISLLEAMAAGVPVLASRVGGIAETLGDGACLVDPHSVEALARHLDALVSDPAARGDLGRRGRRLVTRDFGSTRMVDAYHELYDRIRRPLPNHTEVSV